MRQLKVSLLVVITCVAYAPALGGGFLWDDDPYLTQSPLIKASDGLYRYWFTSEPIDYYPVSNTTLWIEWRLWGMNPKGYHVTNLAVHIISALLVWRILSKLSVAGSYLAALLFAVHPVNAEAVAWIAQRKDVLAVLFALASVLCYVRDEEREVRAVEEKRERGEEEQRRGKFWGIWYWLSLLTFVLAMLSKGSVATLPVIMLGIVAWRRRTRRSDWWRILPFFAVAAVLTVVNIAAQHATVATRNAGFFERLVGAGAAIWFYLSKALLPIRLSLVYPQWQIRGLECLWLLPVGAAALLTCVLLWRSHWRRSKWARAILFAWLFFCVALAPMLGFTDVGFMYYTLVADHYQHIAIIGVAAAVAAGWSVWHDRSRGTSRSAANSAALALVGMLTLLTLQQSRLFGNAIPLYEATLRNNPDCWVMHNSLGVRLQASGRPEEAKQHFEQAVQLKPDYVEARNNLGNELSLMGRTEEAIACFNESMKIQPGRPDTYFNLGNVYAEMNRPEQAAEQYLRAVQLKPDYAEAWANLAAASGDLNRWDDARAAADSALKFARSQGLSEVAAAIEAWRASNAAQLSRP